MDIRYPVFLLLVSIGPPIARGQQVPPLQVIDATLGGVLSGTEQHPFWISSNRNGLVDSTGSLLYVRLKATRTSSPAPHLHYAVVAELFARKTSKESLFFHQAFGLVRYAAFQFSLGWREHTAGLVDSTLSSGSMIFSRNAATIPRIGVETQEFTNIPGTFGLVAFKAHWSHGWLGSKRYVENSFLHEKSLHLRFFGPEGFPILGYAGVTHAVVWGGTHPVFGEIPTRLSDYWHVVLNRAGQGENIETEPTGTLGNSVAAVDFALELNLPEVRALLYRQFYMEAQSDIRFRNKFDGIWGISIQRKRPIALVSHALYELIYTKQQGDRISGSPRTDYSAYYSHGIYQTGWTHRGRTLGNPLLFSDGSLIYPIKNTILVAHHVGFAGFLPGWIHYKVLATYSRNYGARDDCTDDGCTGNPQYYTGRLDQYSLLIEVVGPRPVHSNLEFTAAVAFDSGKLYPISVSGIVGVKWTNQ